MSQPTVPAIPPRPTSVLPKIIFWVLIVGLIAGFIVLLSIFWIVPRMNRPQHVAWVQFQVLPPYVNPLTEEKEPEPISNDEIARFIARQRIMIADDGLLEEVLKSDAFQYDYHDKDKPVNARRKSRFLLENPENPKAVLTKAIKLFALSGTDLYRLTMSGNDPQEIQDEVHDFALVYENYLRIRANSDERKKLDELQEIRKELQQRVDIAKQTADAFREAHDIPGSGRLNDRVSQIEDALVSAMIETNHARSNYEAIKKQNDSKPSSEVLLPVNQAKQAFTTAQDREEDLRARRNDLLLQAKDLDHWLPEYQNRMNNVQRQQKLLSDLDQKILLIEIQSKDNASRIRQFGASGVPE